MDFVFGGVLKFFLGLCIFFFVSWVGHLYANLALQDSTPCLVNFLACPLFFLAGLVFDGDVFLFSLFFSLSLSLSISLSGAGEIQTF